MTADRLHILTVDDERTQLEDLARMLRSFSDVAMVECASDGHEALGKVVRASYDAIFLDVKMPDLDGLELARVLRRFAVPPQLVFVSAYDSAAVDAFELQALDYLLKPVSRRRLQEAVARVVTALDRGSEPRWDGSSGTGDAHQSGIPTPAANGASDVVAVANVLSGSTHLISRGSILFVQSHGDFVRIVTAEGRYLLRTTLSELERRWASFGFVRVHRQYLANLTRTVELRPQLGGSAELVFGDGQSVPVARRQSAELSRRLRV